MATQETIVDSKPYDSSPIDTSVTIPQHVKDAAAKAEAAYHAAYPPEGPVPAAQPDPAAVTAAVTIQQPAQQQPVQQPVQQQVQDDNYTAPANAQDLKDSIWAARYNSMQGRWQAVQRQLGIAQEQNMQLGQELTRSQELLSRAGVQNAAPAATTQPQRHHGKLITDADREIYGDELLETVGRAAKEAIAPELDALRQENAELKKTTISNAQRDMYADLNRLVPNWRAINNDPSFKAWLNLPNIYTNEVRGQMLSAAHKAANTPRVVALFQDFVKEVVATGGQVPGTRVEQQTQQQDPNLIQQQQAPQDTGVTLESLAAPGRARPAGGDPATQSAEKPIYSRAQIAGFYRDVRRGVWAGRETDKDRLERDIIAAQAEGRVR